MQPAARSQTNSIKHGLSDLLADTAAGDKSAFARLYGMTTRKLYGVALRIMRDRLAAEDVMQEAYFRVWRNAASFDPEVASPMTWMASIVRHCAIDVLRKQLPSKKDIENQLVTLQVEPYSLERQCFQLCHVYYLISSHLISRVSFYD